MRLALACWRFRLCLPSDRITGVGHQAELHFLSSAPHGPVPSSAKSAILISHPCLKIIVHCSDGWILKSNVIFFFNGCNPSPQNFCYLLDHRMGHTPWKRNLHTWSQQCGSLASSPSLHELFSSRVNYTTALESLLCEARSAVSLRLASNLNWPFCLSFPGARITGMVSPADVMHVWHSWPTMPTTTSSSTNEVKAGLSNLLNDF